MTKSPPRYFSNVAAAPDQPQSRPAEGIRSPASFAFAKPNGVPAWIADGDVADADLRDNVVVGVGRLVDIPGPPLILTGRD